MIIDIHTHPVFPSPEMKKPKEMELGTINGKFDGKFDEKLDVINKPHTLRKAMAVTSQQYNGRPPCAMPLNKFKKEMDEEGIDMVAFQVGIAKGASAKENNERVSKIMKQFDGRAIGFAGVDPNVGEQAVKDLEYAVNELGFKGMKIVPSILGLDINDKILYPCYAKAEELGIPVMIHTGTGLILGCRAKHVHPLMVDDVAFDFPNLKIICAHLGGWNYLDVHSLLVRHPNVYADLSAWPLSPQYMKIVPWELLEETVPDKIFYGSDYPAAQTPKEALEAVKTLPVSDDFKKKILGENAAKLFGLIGDE